MVSIPAIKVRQWLSEWDNVPVNEQQFQSAPPHEFFVTSIRASDLRALSGVYRRSADTGSTRSKDTYIQRTLENSRSAEIRRYLRSGYPLSTLSDRRMSAEERTSLAKPGWLPTAIVANVIPAGDLRNGNMLSVADSMTVRQAAPSSSIASIEFPESWTPSGWKPQESGPPPLEIIDGQHRLSAFDEDDTDDFELPVVLFSGLDFSWQAYLFWTINIKPKRINASLAYDLYPLLREQDWLEAGETLNVYRETRAQELVEVLWANPQSIWFDRINMLGQPGMRSRRPVTQAAFIRSLSTTFVRPFKGHHGLGGLFGGSADQAGLDWPRVQQAAFLVYAWNSLAESITSRDPDWARPLRSSGGVPTLLPEAASSDDPAIVGDKTLLASDQGVRGFHMVVNDLAYIGARDLLLSKWQVDESLAEEANDPLQFVLEELADSSIGEFIRELGNSLAAYDWRNSQAPGLQPSEKESKLALRGAGGYNVLRDRLLAFLATTGSPRIAELAARVQTARNG